LCQSVPRVTGYNTYAVVTREIKIFQNNFMSHATTALLV